MKKLLFTTVALGLAVASYAQFPDPFVRFQFDPQLQYDESIPAPEDHLGYRLGERFTLYADAVSYFISLAESSDKITINSYGETYEGRGLYNVVITSTDNQANIEQLRQRNLAFSSGDEVDEDLIESQPVFVSYSYNIHGNEASSTEAAMQASYRLVAAQDAETADILENTVIIFYVCINPDGRDRYTYWYNGVQRSVTGLEPADLEHFAPWPNGRTNHYWFDLNRDWVWGVHPESRGHIGEYQKWMPQVHVDYHEQGYNANYFTVPGTTPTNRFLPDVYMSWADTFGRANIQEFDKHDIGYFTRERFDFFYPSYGSSYPSVMGAIGMLTEQGGIGGGTAIETSDGHVLTLRQRVFDHYTTSIATIRAASRNGSDLIRYQVESMNPANSKSDIGGYVIKDNGNVYVPEVIRIMRRHGVVVQKANSGASLANGYDYRSGERTGVELEEGDYVINADQSRNLFIHSIMVPTLEIEDSVMYDMSTWSAVLAYNLEAYHFNSAIGGDLEVLEEDPDHAFGLEGTGDYAYTIDWDQRYAPRALSALWAKGYRVRTAESSFHDGDELHPAGSLVVLVGRNLDKVDRIESDMNSLAAEAEVVIKRHSTGRMMEGLDLTSPDMRPVTQPRVALLVEPPFSTYTAGQLYFLFDQDTRLPVERIRISALQQSAIPKFGLRYGGADLHDYDVLILPGGGRGLDQVFGEKEREVLKNWVSGGGVIIAQESAAAFFTKERSGLTGVELHEPEKDTSETAKYIRYSDRTQYFGKKNIPGASMNAVIDNTNPLAFGVDSVLHCLKFGSGAFEPSTGYEIVGHFVNDSENLLSGGYASKENLEALAGKVFAAVVEVGNGKIVLMHENPQYRMFWRGPSRMVQNAVMLLPGF